MKLALIQSKQNELYNFIDIQKKWCVSDAKILQEQMLEQNYAMMEEAAAQGAELIVTSEAINFAGQPERFVDISHYRELIENTQEAILERVRKIAEKFHCWIIVGMYRRDLSGNLYNSAYVFNSGGDIQGIYDKVHLAGTEKENLAAGNSYPVYDTPFGKIGICICWDMQFPECARILSLKGADMIVCPTWGWEGIYGHARAYENGIYVAAAMGVPYWMDIEGIRNPSEVVAPDGNILARAGRREKEILFCEINIRDCAPYRKLRMDDRRSDTYNEIKGEKLDE